MAGDMPGAGLTASAIAVVFVFSVITGIIGGCFPAMRLSALDLAYTAKGSGKIRHKSRLQSILIVAQFASSVLLIVCTLAATSQLSLMRNMDLGFNKEGVLMLTLNAKATADRVDVLRQRLQSLPEVASVSASSERLGAGVTSNGYLPEGMEKPVMIKVLDADEHFLDVYGIKLKAGRFFSGGEQDKPYYVVNEALAKTFGWNSDAIGKTISRDGRHEIIGIVSDFNFAELYSKVEPLIITNTPQSGRFYYVSIKYNTAQTAAFVSKVEKIWDGVNPGFSFEYVFNDEFFDRIYSMEITFRDLFAAFAVIAILLAALGVLSLMAYAIEQRKKEIGIRKVLGASVADILVMLLRRTGIQVLIANLIACPLAWWGVQTFLSYFAYRITLGPALFIPAFLLSALSALLAVGFQALKASTANPVDAIKVE
jgi:putative ABC transport system permease protein